MAFGLNIDFNGIIGSITDNLKSLGASTIQNLSKSVKTNLINTATSSLGGNIKSMIGTSLNLNLSKKQADSWTTKATGITPTEGSKADSKAGRTKGRFLKGKL